MRQTYVTNICDTHAPVLYIHMSFSRHTYVTFMSHICVTFFTSPIRILCGHICVTFMSHMCVVKVAYVCPKQMHACHICLSHMFVAYVCRICLSHRNSYVCCICLSLLHTCVFVLVRRPVWDWCCRGGIQKHNTVSDVHSMAVHAYSFPAWVPWV